MTIINKSISNIKFKIWAFFYYTSPIYICLNPFKVFNYWWKSRKYFKFPIIIKYKLKRGDSLPSSDYFYMNTDVHNKWLHIDFRECGWKSKYDEVRFEHVPYIIIVLFKKVWVFGFEAPLYEQYKYENEYYWTRNNLLYWECILGYVLRYNKDLIKTYNDNIWIHHIWLDNESLSKEDKEKLKIPITVFPALTERGKRLIMKNMK